MNGVGPRIVSLVFSNTAVFERKGEKAGERGKTKGRGEGSRTGKNNEGKSLFYKCFMGTFFFFFRLVTKFPSLDQFAVYR